MAKGRSGRDREVKKPKADKKAATTATTFLRPGAADAKTAVKEAKK